VGAVAINHLVLLGVCFINGGHHTSKTRYPFLMALIHARMLPAALALLVCAASTNAQTEGKYSQFTLLAVDTHLHF
jgi:Ca2+/H+ antiporter